MAAVATDALDSPSWSSNARSLVDRESVGALVLTAAIPFLFIHERFQPELAIARRLDVDRDSARRLGAPGRRRRCADRRTFGVARAAGGRSAPLDLGSAPHRMARICGTPPRSDRRRAVRRAPRELPQVRRVRAARGRRPAACTPTPRSDAGAARRRALERSRNRRRAAPTPRERHLLRFERGLETPVVSRTPRPRRALGARRESRCGANRHGAQPRSRDLARSTRRNRRCTRSRPRRLGRGRWWIRGRRGRAVDRRSASFRAVAPADRGAGGDRRRRSRWA